MEKDTREFIIMQPWAMILWPNVRLKNIDMK